MENNKPSFGIIILIATLVIGISICVWAIFAGDLTDRESLLMSIVLTVISAVGSWITSHYYAEYSSNKNLRVFALKAAEKVTNLSNELDRLSIFLQQELENDEYEAPNQALLARDSRIEGAIHIINTLKSVNDKSLSDWQGVIGDEIIARQEKQEEREEDLRHLVERVTYLYETDLAHTVNAQQESNITLRNELENIKSDVRLMASLVGGVPVISRKKKTLPPMEQIEFPCPECAVTVKYQQRPKINGFKRIVCTNCGTELISHFANNQFSLTTRELIPEGVACPNCSEKIAVELDAMPGSSVTTKCGSCQSNIRVYRTASSIGVKILTNKVILPATVPFDENLIEQVKNLLPPQPWAKGTSKDVARKLGVPINVIAKAVDELIKRGVFKPQIDGQIIDGSSK